MIESVEHALVRHASGSGLAARLELFATVEVTSAAQLRLGYRLRGELERVLIAAEVPPQRTERLWERTCFEAFVAPAHGERYVEINVAPSRQWAVYAFDGYRTGMRPLELMRPPAIAVERQPTELRVTADVDLSAFADAGWPWRVGLAAVVAAVDEAGSRSFWALRHGGARPDFHDAASFTLRLEGKVR